MVRSVSLMAEKTAIFGGVALRKGILFFRGMTFHAEFFRLFFLHLLETAVVCIFWQFFCGLFRGVEQEKENSGAGEDEGDIQEERSDPFIRGSSHGFCSGC